MIGPRGRADSEAHPDQPQNGALRASIPPQSHPGGHDADPRPAAETGRRDPPRSHALDLSGVPRRHRRAGPAPRRQGLHAQALRRPRLVRGPDLRRCQGLRGAGQVQQARPGTGPHLDRGPQGLPARLRDLSRAPPAHLPRPGRGQQRVQPRLPGLLRQRGRRLQPDPARGRRDARPLRRARRAPGSRPVLGRRTDHPPRPARDDRGARRPATSAT